MMLLGMLQIEPGSSSMKTHHILFPFRRSYKADVKKSPEKKC